MPKAFGQLLIATVLANWQGSRHFLSPHFWFHRLVLLDHLDSTDRIAPAQLRPHHVAFAAAVAIYKV
jgi:hypothetical protein